MASLLDRVLGKHERVPKTAGRADPREREGEMDETIDDAFLGRLRQASLASRRGLTSGLMGEHSSPRRAAALEFADYRSYSPGDDFRRVDWNAYLRLDQLLVKLADAPERLTLHLLLDISRSMDWGHPNKFAYARRLAIGLSYVALAHMDTANLMALHGGECLRVSSREGPKALPALVRAAGGLRPDGTTVLDDALASFGAQGHHRGIVVLISDLLSPGGYQNGLERLSRAALRPVVVHILSRDEVSPTLEGDLALEDVETGETVQVSVDWATRARYQQWLRGWFDEIEAFCSRRGITYVRVDTSQPVEELLLGRLRHERVLK